MPEQGQLDPRFLEAILGGFPRTPSTVPPSPPRVEVGPARPFPPALGQSFQSNMRGDSANDILKLLLGGSYPELAAMGAKNFPMVPPLSTQHTEAAFRGGRRFGAPLTLLGGNLVEMAEGPPPKGMERDLVDDLINNLLGSFAGAGSRYVGEDAARFLLQQALNQIYPKGVREDT